MDTELDRDILSGGSAFQKLLNRLNQDAEGITLDTVTRARQADVDLDATLNDLTDGWNNGSLFRREDDYLAAVESAKRDNAAFKNSVLLDEANRKQDLNSQVGSVQRFFALDPADIDRTVPKDSGFRKKVVFDTKTRTITQEEDKSIDEATVRRKEIADYFDIPEDAVAAKEEQEAAINYKLQEKKKTLAREVLKDEHADASDKRAAAKELRAQQKYDEKQRLKNTVLGQREEALARTKGLARSEMEDMLRNPDLDAQSRAQVQMSLDHYDHLAAQADEKDLRKLQSVEARKYVQEIQKNFDLSPALVDKKFLGENKKLDLSKVWAHAHLKSAEIVKQNRIEWSIFDRRNVDHDYGVGGTYTTGLDGDALYDKGLPAPVPKTLADSPKEDLRAESGVTYDLPTVSIEEILQTPALTPLQRDIKSAQAFRHQGQIIAPTVTRKHDRATSEKILSSLQERLHHPIQTRLQRFLADVNRKRHIQGP